MRYIFVLLVLVASCKSPEGKAENTQSSQRLEAAKQIVDTIHSLMRSAASNKVPFGSVEPRIELLKADVKKYSMQFTGSDSVAFHDYDRKKEEETMEWINKNTSAN